MTGADYLEPRREMMQWLADGYRPSEAAAAAIAANGNGCPSQMTGGWGIAILCYHGPTPAPSIRERPLHATQTP